MGKWMWLIVVAGMTGGAVISQGACRYANTVYHAGDHFAATDGCNTCSCNADGTVGCTELGCLQPAPREDFSRFAGASRIHCEKWSDGAGVKWEVYLRDEDGDGEFLLWAYRAKAPLYHPEVRGRYLALERNGQRGRIGYESPRHTVYLDLTRAHGDQATGYFSTERFGYQVSNLACRPYW